MHVYFNWMSKLIVYKNIYENDKIYMLLKKNDIHICIIYEIYDVRIVVV